VLSVGARHVVADNAVLLWIAEFCFGFEQLQLIQFKFIKQFI
jgi:hypothetical protein